MNTQPNHTVKEIVYRSTDGPTSFDILHALLGEIAARQRRIETRLVRLMERNGLDEYGQTTDAV